MFRVSRVILLSCLLVGYVFGSVDAFAQFSPTENTGTSILRNVPRPDQALKSMSLLDPERFTMKNQYMMSFSSSNGNGSLVGTYINSMEYRFNAPIVMRMKVAYQSKTGHLFGNKDGYSGNPHYDDGRVFIPSFDVIYQPFKNTTVGVFYRDYSMQSPYGYGYGYGYGYPYSMRRMGW